MFLLKQLYVWDSFLCIELFNASLFGTHDFTTYLSNSGVHIIDIPQLHAPVMAPRYYKVIITRYQNGRQPHCMQLHFIKSLERFQSVDHHFSVLVSRYKSVLLAKKSNCRKDGLTFSSFYHFPFWHWDNSELFPSEEHIFSILACC